MEEQPPMQSVRGGKDTALSKNASQKSLKGKAGTTAA